VTREEIHICVRDSIKIALVVGIILSLINQYQILFTGFTKTAEVIKVGMNFVVPFSVASYSRYKLIKQQKVQALKGDDS
jgi:amino acid permease